MGVKVKLAAALLSLSLAGVGFLQRQEGTELVAYLDPIGIPTICTGSTRGVYLPMRATPAECEQRLVEDTTYAGDAVHREVRVKLTQEMYDSLVSFVFNVGPGAFRKSTLLVRLNLGDYCGAGMQFYRWNRAGGKVLPGLTKRRRAEAVPFIEECK